VRGRDLLVERERTRGAAMSAVPIVDTITLNIIGIPQPKGSMSAVRTRGGHTVMLEGKSNTARAASRTWREAVETAARDWQHGHAQVLLDEPLRVDIAFFLPRPKSAPKRRVWPDRKPDVDKLVRHSFDALTGIIWADDARVCDLHVRKHYAVDVPPGATITIGRLT
jgi:crossover junction endodeoxyribonuclease RusA